MQFSEDYWILMERKNKISSLYNEKKINTKNNIFSLKKSFIELIRILKGISLEIFLSIILVLVFQVLDNHYNISAIILQYLNYMTTMNLSINSSDYTNILTTLAQISGVFIGLYITAISVVISTAYVKVPENVRSLFLNQTMGKYPKIVAFLGSVTLILLLINTLNVKPSLLNLVLVIILGLISIFSFLKLVLVVFNLFNPRGLIDYLNEDLFNIIQSVTIFGSEWEDQKIQVKNQRKAEELLKTNFDILKDSVDKKLEGESINKLTFQSLNLLDIYTSKKFFIPLESQWFKLNPKYPNWLAMDALDYSEIDNAVQTKTSINPDKVPDSRWFEKKIQIILDFTMEIHIEKNDLKSGIVLMKYANKVIFSISRKLAISEAITFLHIFDRVIYLKPNKKYLSPRLDEKEEFLIELSLIKSYSGCLRDILLGFHEYFRLFKAEYFDQLIKKIDWDDEKSLYGFPSDVLKQLKYLQKGIKFEQKVEGVIISPPWYQTQIAVLGLARFFSLSVEELIFELENYLNKVKILLSNKKYIFGVQFILSGLEICDKFQIDDLESYFEEMSKLRKVDDIPWPEINWENHGKRLDIVKKELVVLLAQNLIEIAQIPYLEHLPDYFGQSYIFIMEECFESLINNDLQLFKKIFPFFFMSSISAPTKLSDSGLEYTENDISIIRTEPLINVLELSSYAVIFSELYNEDYESIVKEMWDTYIENSENSESVLELYNKLVKYHPLKITQQQIMRTKWSQKSRQKIQMYLNISDKDPTQFDRIDIEHNSPIIRYLLNHGLHYLLSIQIKKIFLGKYIMEMSKVPEIELDESVSSFIEYLKEESQ